ncbi:LysR substrate-binding domain-containing protein [Burkholderia multivorans]|uniref:LysR substrate-binding domain-containing protein n=1 Tax=Burkholderia multivorans TaxID=87883 RepID=UPI00209CA471|nr:LysR substrate-binding domain-containing protein [Burkholderia multivorans]MCO8611160.1 LysR family transcriptional regulator [Burkholderia multivorans]MCO8638051.1 LysR family transcriptional regulator [Burkholderia multivorans]MCO8646204.1 LysR family transcriptional regulator [Burkholderia multivorans]
MEVKWIEDFVALAKHQTFSRAADARHITQSGLSRRIRALEQSLGAELIDRSTYPPTPTTAGRFFLEAAEEVLTRLADVKAVIQTEQRIPGVGLQIAAGHAIAVGFLPAWIRGWREDFGGRYRDLHLRVMPTNVHDSILMLLNGSCELMLVYEHPELPLHLDPTRFQSLTVGRDTFMPVSAPDAHGGARYRLPGTVANPVPLMAYSNGTYFGRCLSLLLSKVKVRCVLGTCFESEMADVLKQIALNGEGIAWLPQTLIRSELESGRLVPAGDSRWTLELHLLLYREQKNSVALLESLWNALASQSGDAPLNAKRPPR